MDSTQSLINADKRMAWEGYSTDETASGQICPSCHGTGRISRDEEEHLVALIPYHDKRLQPSRTKLYVTLSIMACLLAFGLTVFFLWPRTISLSEAKVVHYNVSVNLNQSTTVIDVDLTFNVTNGNFFRIKLHDIEVDISFDQSHIGRGNLTIKEPLKVGSKSSEMFTVVSRTKFPEQFGYVARLCADAAIPVHNILLSFDAKLTTSHWSHTEESSTTLYQYIDCNSNLKIVE